VLLGFTAGGSGWESSVAITTNASRTQIVPRIDFIYAGAPGVYGSGFSTCAAFLIKVAFHPLG
jgi:hypothetical protein